MPVAYNPDTNEAMVLDPETGWIPTKLAVNPDTGDRMAFDGSAWVPIKAKPTPNPAAAAENQWRQGNRMPPIGQPPDRRMAETPGGLLVSTALQAKEKWDNFKAPDLSLLGSPSNERDDPNRGPAFEESLKLMPFAMPGGPPILRTPAGRVSATPRGYSSPGPNPTVPPAPPGGINFRTNEPPESPSPGGSPSPIPPPPVSGQAMAWDGKAWVPASQAMGAPPSPAGPIPPLSVAPVVRPRSGARLLPPETPHSLPPDPAMQGRSSAGAAASGHGPLSELSPPAERMLRQVFEQEGISPYMIEQRIAEMSPHEFLGELSPNLKLHTSGLQSHVGQARNEIQAAVTERAREAPIRMGAAFDEAFGPAKNGFELLKQMKDIRSKDSSAAWKAFIETPIGPFPGMDKVMPRLEAAGALNAANKAMAEAGQPTSIQFGAAPYVPGPRGQFGKAPRPQNVLTAGFFQHAKEHLDVLIKNSLRKEDDKGVMRYTQLKNDLVNAIDNHPDQSVAGLWKTARQQWADPTQLMNAFKLGERVLRGDVHQYQLPMLTESFGAPEMQALAQGMRSHLFDRAGRPGKQDLASINLVLAPSNQAKIAHVIGEEKAGNLVAGISHEHRMHTAPTELIYGSMTAPREAAKKYWAPAEATLPGGVPLSVKGAGRMAVDAGLNLISGKYNAREAQKLEKIREEVARIMTLQGAERDAALYHLAQKPGLRAVGSP